MLKSKPVAYEPFEPHLPADSPETVRAEELLSVAEIRERLAARERSVGDRLASIRAEVTTLDDLTLGGRPALDHIRARPFAAIAIGVAAGAIVGAIGGALSRARRSGEDEQESIMRLLTDSVIDDAARRVALGADPERSLKRVIRRRAPLVNYRPPDPAPAGPIRQSFDLAVKSAVGFGLKAGLDMLTKQLTGKAEVMEAVAEAGADGPGPAR